MLLFEIALLYLLIVLFKSKAALRFIKTFAPPKTEPPLDEVAIFQPILSGDPTLEQTLEGNILPLQGVTFYWLVDNDDPVAHALVDSLRKRHPHATIIKLSYPAAPKGINPKLFKLNEALSSCQQKYCVVLDDDTILPYTTLQGLIAALQHCALATGLPQYKSDGNFPSALLAAFVNNNASMTYLSTLLFMKPITINGMCYAFQRENFLQLGGFESLQHHLTDDLAVAGMVRAQGGNIRQLPDRQIIQTHLTDIRAYFLQMHRWYVFANILFAQQPLRTKALLTVLHGIPPLVLAALFGIYALSPSLHQSMIVLCTLALRHLIITQHNKAQKTSDIRAITLSILSELLQSVHYLHALFYRRIRWRSRMYTVHASDQFESV